jgi:2-hydroxychromene-2-carboxylate isomerase
MTPLTIYHDFASPFCYAAVEVVRLLALRHPVQVLWKPFEVIDYLPPRGAMPQNPAFVRRAEQARAHELTAAYGLPLHLRERLLNSNLALCAVEFSRDADEASGDCAAGRLLPALYAAQYGQGLDLSDPKVVVATAADCGLPEGLEAALGDARYRARVAASRAQAQALGVVAVPTWLAGDYGVVGVPEFAALERLLEAASAPTAS